MLFTLLVLVFSLAVLIKGSDIFVESVARLAKRIGVSEFVIGLTVISIGTSLPELITSVIASFSGNQELIVGTIIGSNIANIGLILGLAASFSTLAIDKEVFHRDGVIMLSVSILFYLFTRNGWFTWVEGLFMLLIFTAYLAYMFHLFSRFRERWELTRYLDQMFGFRRLLNIDLLFDLTTQGIDLGVDSLKKLRDELHVGNYVTTMRQLYDRLKAELVKDIGLSLIGLIGVFIGARFVVESASELSIQLGISDTVIGVVLIAVGTSLPELMVSISAVRKGFINLLVGNIVGSNIANLTLIPGVASLISDVPVTEISLYKTIPALLLFSALSMIFIRLDWQVKRNEGITLLVCYVLFILWILF